jgi:hypothetical protein
VIEKVAKQAKSITGESVGRHYMGIMIRMSETVGNHGFECRD